MQAKSVTSEKGSYNADMAGRPTSKPAPAFGKQLAALRHARGWTQAELAIRLGTTVKMVTYYEREAENPTRKTIEHIAKVLGVDPVELMGEALNQKTVGKSGPPSHLQQLIQRLATLPRSKQKVVIEMLEGFLQKVKC